MDRAEQTEGLASVRWKQLLVFHLRPLPFATHLSIRPHIHTVVSPRNQNVFYTACSGGSSNSTLHLKQFLPARGRRYERPGKGRKSWWLQQEYFPQESFKVPSPPDDVT